ncbi:hypothetical protein CIB95_03685 [Lottiidibacillus patelloidae]|uniref:ABC transporter permease n=1 Tax=Lottiidibacillus patelloidae TaxID=2670334 RepID=A0A263BYN4_9BACI|nr:hypothetical protein CIB95_03685 [Lottiidibacillus patelloidae]
MRKSYNSGGKKILKWIIKRNKITILLLLLIIFIIAGLLDIKYEGLFFQSLPKFIQNYLVDIL